MAKTRANEREFAGQVIFWIKKRLAEGGLPFENATNDSSLYGLETTRFPDVLLTLDFGGLEPFCGWEFKTPKTDARDGKLLKDAVKKAQTLDAKYFVTWNMQTAIIWRTPGKTRVKVNEDDKVQEIGPDSRISSVEDVRDRAKAGLLEEMCRRLVMDLGRLYEDERLNLPVADTTVFVGMVSVASVKLADSLLRDINKARGKKTFDRRLNAWAKKQGVSKYDQEYYETLAQQIAYKIVGKILFYLTLRRQNLQLPRLDLRGKNYGTAMKRMRGLFEMALDYQAIFEHDITDEIELSEESARVIIELTDNLAHWTFELMQLDVIGNVFEKLIPEEARHSLGQYFTPDNLVDMIVAFCVKSENDFVMDPTCGTGTFLIGSYRRLRGLGARRRAHHKLLEQVWGFDIAGFPAELATINLCGQNLSDYRNFPRVLTMDFFDVQPGAKFEFPPPKKTAKTGERITVEIPKLDALMGNFPFIRQELIEKAEKGYKKKLEKVLHEDWYVNGGYRELFRNGNGNNSNKIRLSGQADIYAYMFFHAAVHLNDDGRMGFITSNSWLDVAYGYELQKFFLSKFKLVGIFESRCEPWFEQSAVNTVFTILERCDDEKERAANYVRFVKVKKPLAELFPQDVLTDAQGRWIALEQFVDKVEELGVHWDACGEKDFKKFAAINEEYVKQPEIISYEDDEIRVRMVRQEDLRAQVFDAAQTVKWGQYLRGPDIYFEILEKCADKLVPLSEVANIRRGITTGINEFFYLPREQARHWGIEKEFLKPVVTSTREIPGVFVEAKDLPYRVFSCHKDREELRGTRALKYIKTREKRSTKNGTPWNKVPSVKGRKNWYSVPKNVVADFLVLRFRDRRHYTPINKAKAEIGDVVFVGEFREDAYKNFGCSFLNSTLIALFAEVFGRANLGDGLLTTYGPEIGALLVPKDLQGTRSEKKMTRVCEEFTKLGRRRVLPFDKEVRRRDRESFEKEVFESLGLGEKEYKEVCHAVNELIEERHLLPKLRKARRVSVSVTEYKKLITPDTKFSKKT